MRLLDGAADEQTKIQNTQRIDKEIKAIDSLIGQLLTLAKVETHEVLIVDEYFLSDIAASAIGRRDI